VNGAPSRARDNARPSGKASVQRPPSAVPEAVRRGRDHSNV
jgi:hypothetical protein